MGCPLSKKERYFSFKAEQAKTAPPSFSQWGKAALSSANQGQRSLSVKACPERILSLFEAG